MSKAFGTQFLVVNDVRQTLSPLTFGGGPWTHLATIVRGFREYMCFEHKRSGMVYIEEFDPQDGQFKSLEEAELLDLTEFLTNIGILGVAVGKEFKVASKK